MSTGATKHLHLVVKQIHILAWLNKSFLFQCKEASLLRVQLSVHIQKRYHFVTVSQDICQLLVSCIFKVGSLL